MKWYVLYTSARAEKKVAERLSRSDVELYLPLHSVKRKWSDRIKVVEVPLFNSYLFVKCKEHKLRDIIGLRGVAGVVHYLGKPAIVRDEEIEAIKEFLTIAEGKEIIKQGEEVDILVGPFKDRKAEVLELNDKGATLLLTQLGAKIFVSLHHIEKVE